MAYQHLLLPTTTTTTTSNRAALLAEYASLLSVYNANAPTSRASLSFTTASSSSSHTHASSRLHAASRATATSTSSPSTAPADQGASSSSLLWVCVAFVLVVVLALWMACLSESARMQRYMDSRQQQQPTRRVETEQEEMARRVEAAAEKMKSEMRWFVEEARVRVDDRWRYRMEAERREREMRRRGVWVEEEEAMEVDTRRMEEVRGEMAMPVGEVYQEVDSMVLEWLTMAMGVVGWYFEMAFKGLVKWGGAGGGIWLAYRVLRYFSKHEYERQDSTVDWFLQLALHFSASFLGTIVLPLAVVFGAGWLIVGHDDAVKVCYLCGRTPIDQLHVKYTAGVDLCWNCRVEHEERILKEQDDGAVEQWNREHRMEKKQDRRQEEEGYAQKAATLSSGQRSSPVPWRPQPPNPSVLSLLCSFEDEAKRYSDFRRHNPGEKKYRQKLYNSFEAKQAFMTPIVEERDEYTGPMTRSMKKKKMGMASHKTWNDAWFAETDARLPIETRRLLWPQQPASSKWEKSPYKRFL